MPGSTRVENLNFAATIRVLLEALKALGVTIKPGRDATLVGALSTAANSDLPPPYLHFGSSSAAARLLLGHLAGTGHEAIFDGDDTLRARPMSWVIDPLMELGARISCLQAPGHLPLHLYPSDLKSGAVEMRVGSAQARSAMLLAAVASRTVVDITYPVESRDHTERLLRHLGIDLVQRAGSIRVHGAPIRSEPVLRIPADPSSLAYPVAAHVLSGRKREVEFHGICLNPTRTGFLELLRRMGVPIAFEDVIDSCGEPVGSVRVGPGPERLQPFCIDDDALFHALIDEVPLAFALATRAHGRSRLVGGAELVFKETNRLESTRAMLAAFGARAEIGGDSMQIDGVQHPKPGNIPSFGDHRIAMAAATLATSLEGKTVIEGGSCYANSFPNFIDLMRAAGWNIGEE